MQSHSHEVCPNCHSADQTTRVSAIYHNDEPTPIEPQDLRQAEAVNASWSGSKRWVPDMQVTNRKLEGIAKKLAPPAQPNAVASGPQDVWASGAVAPFAGIIFTITIAVLFGAATLYWSIALAFIFVIIATFLIVRNRQAAAARMMPQWEKAMNRWEEMYYCVRCDGVFTPSLGGLVPSKQMRSLLYLEMGIIYLNAKCWAISPSGCGTWRRCGGQRGCPRA